MPFNLGPLEMVLVLLALLLLFGAKRLPEIGTSLGKGIREFKSSIREVESSVRVDKEIAAGPLRKRRSPGNRKRRTRARPAD